MPRGTVVTVDGRSFTTDTESDDGSRGDRWNFPTGEMPTDLIWPTGQDVTVSVKFPESCPAATTELDYANSWPSSSHSPHSLITRDSVSVLGDTLTVEVQPPPLHHQGTARAEVLEGYKWRFRELKPVRKPWSAWSSDWTDSSTLTGTVANNTTRIRVEVVACTSVPINPGSRNPDPVRSKRLAHSDRLRVNVVR